MSDKRPMVMVFGGPNGSGKTTLTPYFPIVGQYTNADDIVASSGMSNEKAAILVDEQRYRSISNQEDFTFETVLSSERKLNILRKARESGYFIKCAFILTSNVAVNISRVRRRYATGGHFVDEDKISKRYYKSLGNVKELMYLCDILHVYDNTKEPFRIIRKHKESLNFYSNEFWSEEDIIKLTQGELFSKMTLF